MIPTLLDLAQGVVPLGGGEGTITQIIGGLAMFSAATYAIVRLVRHDKSWQGLLKERRENETDLRDRVAELEGKLEDAARRRGELHEQIQKLQRERDAWNRERADFVTKVEELEAQRLQWLDDYAEMERELANVRAALKALMKAQEKRGNE